LRDFLCLFFRPVFRAFFKVINRLEVMDAERVPERGGVIVAANHLSYLDPPVIGAALRRRPTYMAKESLFSIPVVGRALRLFAFPVRRECPYPSTIKETVRRLEKGELVVIFPEGGLTADGSRLEAKGGVGMIASMVGCRIVPVALDGTERALPVGAKLVRPAKITVTFGDPIEVKKRAERKGIREEVTQNVMDAIELLRRRSIEGHRKRDKG